MPSCCEPEHPEIFLCVCVCMCAVRLCTLSEQDVCRHKILEFTMLYVECPCFDWVLQKWTKKNRLKINSNLFEILVFGDVNAFSKREAMLHVTKFISYKTMKAGDKRSCSNWTGCALCINVWHAACRIQHAAYDVQFTLNVIIKAVVADVDSRWIVWKMIFTECQDSGSACKWNFRLPLMFQLCADARPRHTHTHICTISLSRFHS